jgi:hypothetical protein
MGARCIRVLGLACVLAGLLPMSASAREESFSYSYAQVWQTTVRMMRVDFASPITEKDREDGYFFFEYEHDNKKHPGSVQVVRSSKRGRELVRVVIQVPAMPSYVEQMMLDRLERKLGKEHGAPLVRKSEPGKPSPKPDAKDGEAGEGDAKDTPAADDKSNSDK